MSPLTAFGVLRTSLVAAISLAAADLLLRPLPVPAVGMVVGGLLGYWLADRRVVAVVAGVILGAIAGTGLHLRSHLIEGRADPVGGLAGHLAVDAAVGLGVAVGALVVIVLVERSLRRRAASKIEEA